MKIEGKLLQIGETRSVGANGFKIQEVIIEPIGQQFDNTVPIELGGDVVGLLTEEHIGSNVEIEFYLRGRYYEGKYYANVRGTSVALVNSVRRNLVTPETSAPQQPAPAKKSAKSEKVDANTIPHVPLPNEEDDDLPF